MAHSVSSAVFCGADDIDLDPYRLKLPGWSGPACLPQRRMLLAGCDWSR